MIITQEQVQQWFSEQSIGPVNYEADRIARDFVLHDGHRWRPWLFAGVWGSITFAKSVIAPEIKTVACAIECFHKASLIHDDIEDDDKPDALHRSIGVPQALNAGDSLIHRGYHLISTLDLEESQLIMSHCIDAQMKMCRGQGEELYTKRNEYACLKTTPLFQLAFDLAQLLSYPLNCQSEFCNRLGIAFQHMDDFVDEGSDSDALTIAIAATRLAIEGFPNFCLRLFLHHYINTLFGSHIPNAASSAAPAASVDIAPAAAPALDAESIPVPKPSKFVSAGAVDHPLDQSLPPD